jgi:cardiolipin synthase
VLGITDFLDGYIARHFHQESDLGKILDPVADRLLFFVGVGGILVDGSVPVWFAVAVLVREALVAGATLALAALGARRIDVTWFGKAGTFFLMIAFPLFLASESTVGWADTAGTLAWIAGIPGLVLSWYSAALYVPMARDALAEARAEDGASAADTGMSSA